MAASLGNAVGAVGGYQKWREGRKMQKAAQAAIDKFEWQELENPFGDLQVSTLGADLEREELGRSVASTVEALRAGGTRGLGVGAGRVLQSSIEGNRQIAAGLDQQQKQIDFAEAADEVATRNMIENRQANELAGLGQKLNVGMNMKYGGVADMMNAGQSQGQTNQSIMSSIMGGMTGGMMGGGGMGGGGSSQGAPVSVNYGGGLPPM